MDCSAIVPLLETYKSHRVLLQRYVEHTLDLSPAGGMEPTTAEAGLLLVLRSVVQGCLGYYFAYTSFDANNPGWSVLVDSETRRVCFGKGYLTLRFA